jgi:hypothetical protein
MYQPGLDQGLARIRYAQVLEEAAQERAERQARAAAAPKPAARRLAPALAAAAPIAAWIVWMWPPRPRREWARSWRSGNHSGAGTRSF